MKVKHVPNGKMTRNLMESGCKGTGVIVDGVLETKQKYQDTKITTKMSKRHSIQSYSKLQQR